MSSFHHILGETARPHSEGHLPFRKTGVLQIRFAKPCNMAARHHEVQHEEGTTMQGMLFTKRHATARHKSSGRLLFGETQCHMFLHLRHVAPPFAKPHCMAMMQAEVQNKGAAIQGIVVSPRCMQAVDLSRADPFLLARDSAPHVAKPCCMVARHDDEV